MQARRWLLPTVLLLLPLLTTARAEDGPHWEASVDAARRIAAQSNRLVLIHFWARWCGPCRNLEANVFKQPGVGAAMGARFVLAKVNVDIDDGHAIAHAYGIERLPTDVIITPTNRVLAKLACPDNPTQYLAQLDQAAAAASRARRRSSEHGRPERWEFGAADRKSVSESSGRRTECDRSAPGAMPPGSAPPPAYGPMAAAPANSGPGMPGPGVGGPNMNGPGPMAGPPPLPTADNAMASPGMPGGAPAAVLTDSWSGLRRPERCAEKQSTASRRRGSVTRPTARRVTVDDDGRLSSSGGRCPARQVDRLGWFLSGDTRRALAHRAARPSLLDSGRCALGRGASGDDVFVRWSGGTEKIPGRSRPLQPGSVGKRSGVGLRPGPIADGSARVRHVLRQSDLLVYEQRIARKIPPKRPPLRGRSPPGRSQPPRRHPLEI